MGTARQFATTDTSNLCAGFQTVVNCMAVRLVSFTETIGDQDFWWCEKLFVDHADAVMIAFRHGSSYRPLHSTHQ